MTTEFVLPLGTTGLAKDALGFRLYLDGDQVADATAFAETATAGDYAVTSLPQPDTGSYYTLTWEYPTGVGGSYVWPNRTTTPAAVVLPVRETGLSAGDLDLAIYKDGAVNGASLSTTELVAGGGDYKVTGWPTETGNWALVWRRGGISFSTGWQEPDTSANAIGSYVTSKIAAATLRRLQASTALTNYFTGGIKGARHEEIYLNEMHKPPVLLVTLAGVEHTPMPSERWDLTVLMELAICELVRTTTISTYTHADVVDEIRTALWGDENGQLRHTDNEFITCHLTTFQQVPKPVWLPGINQIRTVITVAWGSYVDKDMQFEG